MQLFGPVGLPRSGSWFSGLLGERGTNRTGLHLARAQERLLSSHTDDNFFIWHWR